MQLSAYDNCKCCDIAKGLNTTRTLDRVLAMICISIMGFEFVIGGLAKVVLLIAAAGVLCVFHCLFKEIQTLISVGK